MKEETRNWFLQSDADIKTAFNSMKSGDYYASIFWSQQATEKALKAIIIEKENELIKIHDLVILGRKAQLPPSLLIKCEKLSKAYVESRYGILDNKIPAQKFSHDDAKKFLAISQEVITWLKKILQ